MILYIVWDSCFWGMSPFFWVNGDGGTRDGDGECKVSGAGRCLCGVSDVQRSAGKIHLPQTLNEEAIADEFSDWEQVSFPAAERFAHPT